MDRLARRASGTKRKPTNPEPEEESNDASQTDATAAAATIASAIDGSRINSGIESRVGRFLDTFEDRVAETIPAADTSGSASPVSATATPVAAAESSSSEGTFNDRSDHSVSRIPNIPATSETDDGDSIHVAAARDYLKETGRYEDVDSMSEDQLQEAIRTEALREQLAITHDVHQSYEQLQKYADIQSEEVHQEQWDNARSSLVASGAFTQEEVDAMSNEELAMALEVVQSLGTWEGESSTERLTDDGRTTITLNGDSLALSNNETISGSESGSSTSGNDTSTGSSSGGSTNDSASQDSSQSDDGSDDDDDDDDDDESETDEPEETTPTAEQEEGNTSEGGGEGTTETTPTPDGPMTVDPAKLAAFAASPLGRESNRMVERAVDMGRTGGLIDPAESDAAKQDWLETPTASQELSVLERGVEVARSGGHTDPTEDEAPRGIVPVNELKLIGGGYRDPIEDAAPPPPEDNPLFPIDPGGFGPQLEVVVNTDLIANLGLTFVASENIEDKVDNLDQLSD